MQFSDMQAQVRWECGIEATDTAGGRSITTTDIKRLLNLGQMDVVKSTLCLSRKKSFTSIPNVPTTNLPDDFIALIDCKYNQDFMIHKYVSELNKGGTGWINQTGVPCNFLLPFIRKSLQFYPIDTTTQYSTTLSADILATDAIIKIASISGFWDSGRVLIDNEVIEYGYIDGKNLQLMGCIRGLEGTVAFPHSLGATAQVRNVIYTYFYLPLDMSDDKDICEIPKEYHLLPVYYAAMAYFRRMKDKDGVALYLGKYVDGIGAMKKDMDTLQYESLAIAGNLLGVDEFENLPLGRYPSNYGGFWYGV